MAKTKSTMLALKSLAPDFSLIGVEPFSKSLQDFRFNFSQLSKKAGYLVIFMSNHCPFVKHLKRELSLFSTKALEQNIYTIAINSNDIKQYPDDDLEHMQKDSQDFDYPFPYLFDESQAVAKAYRAACTPDFFLFNGNKELIYRGQFDASRPQNEILVTGGNVQEAINALLKGEDPIKDQQPSLGCNIKWKPGNEPDYFT